MQTTVCSTPWQPMQGSDRLASLVLTPQQAVARGMGSITKQLVVAVGTDTSGADCTSCQEGVVVLA
jgi:hypothetical protein